MNVNVIFINATYGYPFKFSAGNTKVEFMAKGLLANGALVTVLNQPEGEQNLHAVRDEVTDGIRHISFPRKKGKMFSSLLNSIALMKALRQLKQKNSQNILINDFSLFPTLLFHTFLAFIYGYKTVSIFHEWHYSFPHKGLKGISNKLIDRYFGRFADGILPISKFLEEKASRFNKPMLKVPVLADFQAIASNNKTEARTYFLFCGHSRFFRLIRIIIDAFKMFVSENGSQDLVLVLGGEAADVDTVRKYVAELGLQHRVKILTQVPYNELIANYKQALALLIPLDPANKQDQARFSQKIAEYLSVGRPLITVNVGEVAHYFINAQNAFIAQDFTAAEFLKQLKFVSENVELADQVGSNGYNLGKKAFDYRPNGKNLYDFLTKL